MGETFIDRPKQKVVVVGSINNTSTNSTVLADWVVDSFHNMSVEDLTVVIDSLTELRTTKIFKVYN